jgi:hypothetical protein
MGSAEDACYVGEPDNERKEPFALRAKYGLGRFPTLEPGDQAPLYEQLWERAFAGKVRPKSPGAVAAKFLLKNAPKPQLRTAYASAEPKLSPRLRLVTALTAPPSQQLPGSNVVVKSVYAPLAVEWIDERWKPRVLVVMRHPFNVLASWLELGFKHCNLHARALVQERYARRWGIELPRDDESPLARIAWEVGLLTSALEAIIERNPDYVVAGHESLCVEPVSQFKRLYRDVGLRWSRTAEEFLERSNRPGTGYAPKRITSEQPERWRRRLTPEQVEEIQDVLSRFPLRSWSPETASE